MMELDYREVYQAIPSAIIISDVQTGMVLDCNHAAEELTGKSSKEIVKKEHWKLHPKNKIKEYRKRFEECIGKADSTEYDGVVLTKKREKISVLIKAIPVRVDGKDALMQIFVPRPISMQEEDNLIGLEDKFLCMAEQVIDDGIATVVDGVIEFANTAMANIYGHPEESLVGMPFLEIVALESQETVLERYRLQMAGQNIPPVYEIKTCCNNGHATDVEIFERSTHYHGKPAIVVTSRDITERKQTEIKLQRMAELDRIHCEITNAFLSDNPIDDTVNQMLGKAGKYLDVSRAYVFTFKNDHALMPNTHEWCAEGVEPQINNLHDMLADLLPYWSEELSANHVISAKDIHELPDHVVKILEPQNICSILVMPIFAGRELFGFMGFDEIGKYREWHHYEISALRSITSIYGREVERRLAAQELKESEEKFRSVFENMHDIYYRADNNGTITMLNPSGMRFFGYESEYSVIGKANIEDYWANPKERRKFMSSLLKKGKVKLHEVTFKRGDGNLRAIEVNAHFLRNVAGETIGVEGVCRDITERKRVDAEIVQTKNQLNAIMDSATEFHIGTSDLEGNMTSWNKGAEIIMGYTEDDVVGKMHISQLISGDTLESGIMEVAVKSVLEKGLFEGEFDFKRKSGEVFPAFMSTTLLRDETGKQIGMLAIIQDITERRQTEDLLRKRTYDLAERIKELNCLYSISNFVENHDLSQEETLQGIVDLIPSAWQHPEAACARIVLEGQEFKTNNFKQTCWKQTNTIIAYRKTVGTLEVCYLEEMPEADDGPFLKEEIDLVKTIAKELVRVIEHKQMEEQIKAYTENLEYAVIERAATLEQEKAYTQSIISSVPDMLCILNENGEFVYANNVFLQSVVVEPDDIMGKSFGQFIIEYNILTPKSLARVSDSVNHRLQTGEPITNVEVEAVNTRGESIMASYSSSGIMGPKGEILGAVVLLRDISEQNRLEQQVRDYNKNLEATVEERTRELAESEHIYSVIAEGGYEGIVIVKDLRFVFANRRITEITGYTVDEVNKIAVEKVIDMKYLAMAMERYHRRMAGEYVPAVYEIAVIAKDGRTIPVEISNAKVEYQGGPADVIILNDITERKQAQIALQREKNFAESVLQSQQDMLFVTNTEGTILQISKVTESLLGYGQGELIGQSITVVFSPDRLQEVMEGGLGKTLRGEPLAATEFIMQTKSGEQFPAQFTAAPIKDAAGNIIAASGVGRDLREQKQAEKRRETLLRDIENTNRKLVSSNRDLQDFVYIASHDLREPVRKISAFGQLIQDSLGDSLDEDDQENLNFMIDGADRMQEMVDDLLLYTQVTTKAKSFIQVDLNEVIEDIRDLELATQLEETAGSIESPDPLPTVSADRTQMRQLLQNLINNALKYRKKDVSPKITIRAHTVNEGLLQVEVADNGIGIEQDSWADIFAMFGRLHSRGEYEGSGIGLAICKKIVERHGGEIGVESVPSEGSTFWFTIPSCNGVREQCAQ